MLNTPTLRKQRKDGETTNKISLFLTGVLAFFITLILVGIGNEAMTAKYQLAVRITEEEKNQIEELRKYGKSQHDIVRVGLKVLMQRVQKTGKITPELIPVL